MRKLALISVVGIAVFAQAQGHQTNDHIGSNEPAQTSSPSQAIGPSAAGSTKDVTIGMNKSVVVTHVAKIRRVSIANNEIAEAVALSTNEVLLNGKTPGDTTMLIWDAEGQHASYEVHVRASSSRTELVTQELLREAGPNVSLTAADGIVFLRGTVRDTTTADRAFSIASTLGKVVNLLRVSVPEGEPQILLKVRFADVDRSASTQLGVNLFSLNSKGIASSTTGQFGQPPTFDLSQTPPKWNISDLLNIFYYRPDINLGAVLQDLASKNVLQILAEPNLLTMSGRAASFLAGGEFPFPTIQGGASGVGQITIQFKEFGIRLNFIPSITPRGTIHLVVNPEVSSLDYANGLTVSGYTVPALSTRRVQTEIELENGQSFVIAGLLNNQVTEQLTKMPGLANIPVLGKLFESRQVTKSNSELLVMVTPELVMPIAKGSKTPEVQMPYPRMKGTASAPPQTPAADATGPAPVILKRETLPVEELKNILQPPLSNGPPATGTGSQPPSLPFNNLAGSSNGSSTNHNE